MPHEDPGERGGRRRARRPDQVRLDLEAVGAIEDDVVHEGAVARLGRADPELGHRPYDADAVNPRWAPATAGLAGLPHPHAATGPCLLDQVHLVIRHPVQPVDRWDAAGRLDDDHADRGADGHHPAFGLDGLAQPDPDLLGQRLGRDRVGDAGQQDAELVAAPPDGGIGQPDGVAQSDRRPRG